MLDGRVKTLHPKIHGGLLARRDDPTHIEAMRAAGIEPIDLLVVNLYPFQAAVADPDCRFEDAIENIDIGGPAMLRSAAKNHAAVAVVVDPADYPRVLQEIRQHGAVSEATRFGLATKVFAHTAAYDGAIANYLTSLDEHAPAARLRRGADPAVLQARRPALRREPAPERRFLPRRCIRWRAASRGTASSRARSSPTTTSPTPMRPGNASRASPSRPA